MQFRMRLPPRRAPILVLAAVTLLSPACATAPAAPAVVPTAAASASAPAEVPTTAAAPTAHEAATTAVAATNGQIQFAWSGPLTGDAAQLGQGYLNGVQMATDEWNAKGGLLGKTIAIKAEDDGCDPKQAGSLAQKIADDPRNVLLFGPMCSGVTLAGGPIWNKANLPEVTISTNATITEQGWQNVFRPVANDNDQGKAGVTYVMQKLGAKKFALLHDKLAYGQGVADVAKTTIESAGGTVTSLGGVEPKEVDYHAVITKIVEAERPDAILYCTNFPSSAGLMVNQIRQAGFNKPIIGCDGYYDPAMIKAAGDAANKKSDAQAVYFPVPVPPYDATDGLRAFAASYKAKFGNEPQAAEVYGYDSANLAFSAVKAAGAEDHAKVIEALKSGAPGVLIPRYAFDEHGNLKDAPRYIFTVAGGKFALVAQGAE